MAGAVAMENPTPSSHILDPAGDRLLVVNKDEKQQTFRVSSKAMCLASPVWRAMLDLSGPWKEAQYGSHVNFPEDDPNTLRIVLDIVHFHFHRIPNTLTYEQLLNLAILCDKYDTARLVLFWFQLHWKSPFSKYAQDHGKECSLLIAWVFLDEVTFSSLATRLVTQYLLNEEEKFDIAHHQILDMYMPLGMMGKILEARSAAMKAVKAVPELLASRFANHHCVCKKGSRACDAIMLGSLMRAMDGVGLLPGLLGSNVLRLSPELMWQKLNEAQFWLLKNHEKCDLRPEWQSELLAVKKAWPTALDLAFGEFAKQGPLSLFEYVCTYILIAVAKPKNS